ncbi:MAG: PriCT-2 domain-containing protein [Croceibacterium sp.]
MNNIVAAPALSMITAHLATIADGALDQPQLRIEVAWGTSDHGPNRARLFPLRDIASAARLAAEVNRQGCNVYVGVTLKAADAPPHRRTASAHATLATCIAIDIDGDLLTSARALQVRPHLLVVTGTVPCARAHIWLQISPTTDLRLWNEVTTRAVARCGGDMAARGASRVMRLAGTLAYPSAAKRARGYGTEFVRLHELGGAPYDVAELSALLPQQPEQCHRRAPAVRRGASKPHLHEVETALDALPTKFASEYELWLRVGFALHDFDQGPAGLALWTGFSHKCAAKAAVTDFDRRWYSFGRADGGKRITIRWLLAQARESGWRCKVDFQRRAIAPLQGSRG